MTEKGMWAKVLGGEEFASLEIAGIFIYLGDRIANVREKADEINAALSKIAVPVELADEMAKIVELYVAGHPPPFSAMTILTRYQEWKSKTPSREKK